MSNSTLPLARSITRPPRQPADAVRVRFVAPTGDVGSDTWPLRQYADPHPAVAVLSPVEPTLAPAAPAGDDQLLVLRTPDEKDRTVTDDWLAGPASILPVDVPLPAGRLRWQAGRAVIAGPVENRDAVLAGLVDFAFYESALRQLEAAVTAHHRTAPDDVRLAYRVDDADRGQWPRLARTMEQLAQLRLTFARLEPRLSIPPRDLPPAGRRAFRRLLARADVEDRLTAVSDQLEACEDLYEGAVDRVTDHRWWRRGHRLETIIVVLLAAEGVQLAAELVLHLLHR